MRDSASASSVPSTQATTAFTTATIRLVWSGSRDRRVAKRLAEPLRREALPVEDVPAAVEGEDDDDEDREVEEGVDERPRGRRAGA